MDAINWSHLIQKGKRIFQGLLKKTTSGVLIAGRAQRTQCTPRPSRGLRPCWTAIFNSPCSCTVFGYMAGSTCFRGIFKLFNRPFTIPNSRVQTGNVCLEGEVTLENL